MNDLFEMESIYFPKNYHKIIVDVDFLEKSLLNIEKSVVKRNFKGRLKILILKFKIGSVKIREIKFHSSFQLR